MDRFYKKQEELSDLNKLEQAKERQRQDLEKEEQIRTDRELEQKRELAQETRHTLLLTEQKKTLEGFFRQCKQATQRQQRSPITRPPDSLQISASRNAPPPHKTPNAQDPRHTHQID